jgi:hypothetical protein
MKLESFSPYPQEHIENKKKNLHLKNYKKIYHFLLIAKRINIRSSAMLASGALPATCITEDIPYVQGRQGQSLITEPLPMSS